MPHAVGEEEYSPLSTAGEIGEKMRSGDATAVEILAEGQQAWNWYCRCCDTHSGLILRDLVAQ
jgi:hypothetical protein